MQHYTDLLIKASGFKYDEIKQEIYKPFYRPIDIQVQIGDSSDLKKLTGWEPVIPIDQTMKDLLDYWVNKLGKENK
jgi:nucleoside-diphosphate-sugar epimerase